MVKTTINDDWKNYIVKQIERGVDKKKLENVLKKQNYSNDIINQLLNFNEIESNLIKINNNYERTSDKISHSIDPLVATYSNFISDEECEHFINISKNKLKQALVSDASKGITSKGRTGSNAWINHNFSEITKNVGERIAKVIGIPLKNAESFQIIHYDNNQEYRNHYDSWEHDNSEKTLRCMKYGGARLMTALCYLNSVEKGGGTRMSKLNITIPAEKGKLLVFQNTISKDNNNRHSLSEHAGTPVEIGEKYAFNLWFRECPINMIYKDFNPNYYRNNTIRHKKKKNFKK